MSNAEYKSDWYQKNREAILVRQRETNARVRKEKQDYIRSLKEESPCSDCGNNYPYYVMDFDHVSGDKLYNIGDMLGSKRSSWKALLAEIDKCEIVCSNCHRIRTHNRKAR